MQYKSTTEEIEVTVNPEYLESQLNSDGSFFVWTYHIEIENKSSRTIQLLNRYWRIIDESGEIQEVTGLGVIGEQPILPPNDTFKYSSNVRLRYPSGVMSGYYGMKQTNGALINIQIPAFSLDVPNIKSIIH